MPTRNVVLSEHQQALVETLVQSGRYQNASEVLREGLRLIEERERIGEAKLSSCPPAAPLPGLSLRACPGGRRPRPARRHGIGAALGPPTRPGNSRWRASVDRWIPRRLTGDNSNPGVRNADRGQPLLMVVCPKSSACRDGQSNGSNAPGNCRWVLGLRTPLGQRSVI
jgi:putative addiction module CopG family antidote